MLAVRYSAFGGREVLSLDRVANPQPAEHGVVVRVAAAAINPLDYKLRSGLGPFRPSLPAGVGRDFSGVVAEVGPGSRWTIGDRVFGAVSVDGSLAEYTRADDDELVRLPSHLDFSVAATLGIAGQTAWRAVDALSLTTSDTLLVTAAAGGVGSFACQLAARAGAKVVGTASAQNRASLEAMGVVAVDYASSPAGAIAQLRVLPTAALDLAGEDGIALAREVGVPADRIITIATDATRAGVRSSVRGPVDPAILTELAQLVVAGELAVPLAGVFGLDDFDSAFSLLESRHLVGKVVVKVR